MDKATPWKIIGKSKFIDAADDTAICQLVGNFKRREAVGQTILRAVNCFDELVDALLAYQITNPFHLGFRVALNDGEVELYYKAEAILKKAKEET